MLAHFARRSAVSSVPRALARPVTRWNSTRLYSSTMHENDPEVLETEKQRNLSRNPHDKTHSPHDYAPGWNEVLASVSEAAVKADKSEAKANVSELQEETVEQLTIQRTELDGEASTTAHYVRDTVTGPLSGAFGKEEEPMTPSEEDVKADRGEF